MNITELNNDIFTESITLPVILIDFYAPWCGPCRNMARELEKFSAAHPDIPVGKINIEEDGNKDIAAQFDISTIPSLFFFRDGQLVKHLTGFYSCSKLEKELGIN
jgi:thioredoxin